MWSTKTRVYCWALLTDQKNAFSYRWPETNVIDNTGTFQKHFDKVKWRIMAQTAKEILAVDQGDGDNCTAFKQGL